MKSIKKQNDPGLNFLGRNPKSLSIKLQAIRFIEKRTKVKKMRSSDRRSLLQNAASSFIRFPILRNPNQQPQTPFTKNDDKQKNENL